MLKAIFLLVLACAALELVCAEPPMPGGFYDVDIEDDEVIRVANHATEFLSKILRSQYHHKLASIIKAQQQVVAGINYKLDVIIGMTNCKKEEISYDSLEDCDFQENADAYKKCEYRVYKHLNGKLDVTRFGCKLPSIDED